jgi:hypothetical protein
MTKDSRSAALRAGCDMVRGLLARLDFRLRGNDGSFIVKLTPV